MAVYSPLASRRASNRKAKPTIQLIAFSILSEKFALPILAVYKVTPLGKTYGAPGGKGVSLTLYQDKELLVLDVERRIFNGVPKAALASGGSQSTDVDMMAEPQRYLLILQDLHGKLVGLPIDTPPSLIRVPESAFTPLTADYLNEGNLRCVSALVVRENDDSPLFLLNPNQLVQSQKNLPQG